MLTQMSKFWFDYTQDLLPNHMLSVDVQDMPEFFRQPQFDGNSMLCRKLTMLPVECIVRGYITGAAGPATEDRQGLRHHPARGPEGVRQAARAHLHPLHQAEIGDHDENISYEQSITVLEKLYPGKGEEYAAKLGITPLLCTRSALPTL